MHSGESAGTAAGGAGLERLSPMGVPETAETGVLLVNLGAPDGAGGVEPFLRNLFSDPAIIPVEPPFARAVVARVIAKRRARRVIPRYEAIGGTSPLLSITTRQAEKLEARLRSGGLSARVFVGMRYWRPTLAEALGEVSRCGARRLVILPLYPQFSTTTTGSAFSEIKRVMSQTGYRPEVRAIKQWCDFPPVLNALAARVKKTLGKFNFSDPEGIQLVFTAHGIPERLARSGDPYPQQVARTVEGIVRRVQHPQWRLGYQSRVGRGRWLEPRTDVLLRDLCRRGKRSFLVAPVSFVSDHLETLHEIDIFLRDQVESAGAVEFRRTESLNDSDDFIEALGRLVGIALSKKE
ncbi:MAG: ferrochelatase [bacterium]